MQNGKRMMLELQKRKLALIKQLKELNAKYPADETETDNYNPEKNQIERELVEIMDRLTQLNYLLKK
ncbi:MAG: hypothetical protein LUQ65_00145 [Candidatus Helarchaeota archaeon]|nr:hypothetical protein [Candidatus Helarchaeota archaeon]